MKEGEVNIVHEELKLEDEEGICGIKGEIFKFTRQRLYPMQLL